MHRSACSHTYRSYLTKGWAGLADLDSMVICDMLLSECHDAKAASVYSRIDAFISNCFVLLSVLWTMATLY